MKTKEELIEHVEEYYSLKHLTEIEKETLDDHFCRIFKAIHEIQEENSKYKIMGKNYFNSYSTYDGFRYSDNKIFLHYYDHGYDCYDCEEFSIPIEAAESEEKAKEWALEEIKKMKEKGEKEMEIKKKKAEDNEKAEYERLKKKYEGE